MRGRVKLKAEPEQLFFELLRYIGSTIRIFKFWRELLAAVNQGWQQFKLQCRYGRWNWISGRIGNPSISELLV